MTKAEIARMTAKIEKHRDLVGKRRDALNEAILELEGLRDCCSEAWDNLQFAVDALSELA